MRLEGRRYAILVDEGVEDLEYWVTRMRLREEGADAVSVGRDTEPRHGKQGLGVRADVTASEIAADDVDGLVIPGGWAPDKLRRDPEVIALTRACAERGRIVGVICHGGLVAISAGIVQGARAAGSLGIRDDLVNAGATWVDATALRDGNIVRGRVVADIPAFSRELVEAFATT